MIDFGLNAGEIDNNSDIRESYRVVITTPWPVCKLPNIKLACIHEKPFNRTGSIKKASRDSFIQDTEYDLSKRSTIIDSILTSRASHITYSSPLGVVRRDYLGHYKFDH